MSDLFLSDQVAFKIMFCLETARTIGNCADYLSMVTHVQGDMKGESNDSPEISNRFQANVPGLPSLFSSKLKVPTAHLE